MSTQDALIAWVVEVLRSEEGGREVIEKVVNVVNVSHRPARRRHP